MRLKSGRVLTSLVSLIALIVAVAFPTPSPAQTPNQLQRAPQRSPETQLERTPITDAGVVRAPSVVGKPIADARAMLERLGLRPGREGFQSTRDAPAGTVVRQDPAVGAIVKRGEPIHLWIAVRDSRDDVGQSTTNAPRVDQKVDGRILDTLRFAVVPELVGGLASEAAARLDRNRLRLGEQRQEESNAPAGTVVSQHPAPGTRALIGSRVDVVIAVSIQVTVPNLRGTPESEVLGRLRQARLRVGSSRREESGAPAGTVVEQSREPGARVAVGTPVDVVVAIPIRVTVPDLTGAPESDVVERLDRAQLRLGDRRHQESEARSGSVVSQSPKPRSRVPIGTPVSVVVADPILVSVPEVTGLFPADARRLLAERRLLLGRQREQRSPLQPGLIVTQSRPAGARVPAETTVDVTVAIAPTPAVSPASTPPPIVPGPPRPSQGPRPDDRRPSEPSAPPGRHATEGPRPPDDRPPASEPSPPSPAVPIAMPAPSPAMPSNSAALSPTPSSILPSRKAVFWGVGSMLALAAAGSVIYHFRPRRPTRTSTSPAVPVIAFASRWDAGSIRLSPAGPLGAGPGLRLVSGIEIEPPRLDKEHLVTTAALNGGRDDDDR